MDSARGLRPSVRHVLVVSHISLTDIGRLPGLGRLVLEQLSALIGYTHRPTLSNRCVRRLPHLACETSGKVKRYSCNGKPYVPKHTKNIPQTNIVDAT